MAVEDADEDEKDGFGEWKMEDGKWKTGRPMEGGWQNKAVWTELLMSKSFVTWVSIGRG